MADYNDPGAYRPHQPHSRAGSLAEGARSHPNDPLAELARLIGQADPFAELERERSQAEWRRQSQAAAPGAQQGWPEQHTPQAYYDQQSQYAGYDGYADPSAAAAYQERADAYPQDYGRYPEAQNGMNDPAYPADMQGYYGAEEPTLEELEFHEQELRRRKRRRLATVAAVFSLAVVGSAAAFGYRSLVRTGSAASAPPPLIKADASPTKIIPAAKVAENQSNKLIRDRVSDRGGEKMVPREETPVEIKTIAVSPARQAAYTPAGVSEAVASVPAHTIPVSAPAGGSDPLPTAAVPFSSVGTGPGNVPAVKRVHTVTIRPDMTIVPDPAETANRPAPAATAPRTPVERRAALPDPVRDVRPVAAPPRAEPRSAVAERESAPLSLAPTSAPAAPAPVARHSQTAAPAAGAPLNLASATPIAPAAAPQPASHGGYAVQVASQRSEADAMASFRSLQTKYPSVLSGRQPFVRRADLGSRGVYYRTMVGPFASADEAGAFCSSLKAAGGQCLIQRN